MTISLQVVTLLLIAIIALFPATPKPNPKPTADQDIQRLQLEAAKANSIYQQESERQATQLRLEVLKACVSRGDIPVVINGNVGCNPRPR